MQLQKHITRKVNGKEYYKWVLVIPSDQIKEIGWKQGTEVESSIKDQKILIKKID